MKKTWTNACWCLLALVVLSPSNQAAADIGDGNNNADITRIPDALNTAVTHMANSLDSITLGDTALFQGDEQQKWRLFGDAGTGAGTLKAQSQFTDPSFRLRSRFVSAGAERRLGDSLSIGGSFSGVFGKIKFPGSATSLTSDGTMTTVFAKWDTGTAIFGLSSRYGTLNIDDIQRDGGDGKNTLTGETDGEYHDWTVWGALPIESSFGVFTPHAKAVFSRTKVDAFQEDPSVSQDLALSHELQKLKSRRVDLGLRYEPMPLGLAGALKIRPWIDFTYSHEFSDGQRTLVSGLRDSITGTSTFTTASPYRNRFSLVSGAAFELTDNVGLALTYRNDFGKDTVLNSQYGLRVNVKF